MLNVIAEIGSNWGGNVESAKLHIKKSKESGASHVKFQMWRTEDIYETSDPHWSIIKKSELTEDIAKELKVYSDKIVFVTLKRVIGTDDIYIEKHVKLDYAVGPDAPFSISFKELESLVVHAKRITQLSLSTITN